MVDKKELNAWAKKFNALEKKYSTALDKQKELSASLTTAKKMITGLKKDLSVKPKEIIKEIIKEVPVEIIKEVEVVKSIDMKALQAMLANAGTVEISKKVVGETRTVKDAVIVERREMKNGAKASSKKQKDNLKKVEGIGPKIESLLNAEGIFTFLQLSKTKVKLIRDILTAAGPRFKMHNPGTWPRQAGMAAKGQWDKLKKWQDELSGGK